MSLNASEQKKFNAMLKLGMSETEAIQVLEDDRKIDHNEKMEFDLSKEQQKVAKQYSGTGTRKTYTFTKRERKPNEPKRLVIDELFKFLNENKLISAEEITVLNKEKLISFKIGENTFEIDLKQKRKPKNS